MDAPERKPARPRKGSVHPGPADATPIRVASRAAVQINRTVIDQAWKQRGEGVRQVIRDDRCRGLALVVHPTAMVWRFDYRPRGTDPKTGKRWGNSSLILGDPASMTAAAARLAAQAIKGQVSEGKDPARERREAIAQEQQRRATTLGMLAEEYAASLPKRAKLRGTGPAAPAHVANELRALRNALAEMQAADMPPADLKPFVIRGMLAEHGAHPAAARARFGALSRFFDWLLDHDRIPANPCARIPRSGRPNPPASRTHFLSVPKLAQLWTAAAALPALHRDFLRLLIAVPCRRGEAASLDWQHLDLTAGIWTQPGKLTKNREPHVFFLHPLVLALIRARHAASGGPAAGAVFTAPRSGRALTTWRQAKAGLDEAAGLDGWRLHDTRRSFATAVAEAGIPEAVADAVLNHRQSATRAGVLGVYQQAARLPEQRAAMERWGELLATALRRGVFRKRRRFETPPGLSELPR